MDLDLGPEPKEDGPAPPSASASTPPKTRGSLAVPVVTALILIGIFCGYYFVYVRARTEYLTNRDFRALAVLGAQLQSVIGIHGTILEVYSNQYDRKREHTGREKQEIDLFFSKVHADMSSEEARTAYLNYLAPNFRLEELPHDPAGKSKSLVRRRGGAWELVLTNWGSEQRPKDYTGSIKISELLNPFVNDLPFDNILLASHTGAIIYEKAVVGPQFITLTSLLNAQTAVGGTKSNTDSGSGGEAAAGESKASSEAQPSANNAIQLNSDKSWRASTPHLTDVTLAGTSYKLFLQPILVDAGSAAATPSERPREWVLCGLISSKSLEWEALAISYTMIIWIAAFFLMACLCGPMLKVFLLNQREHLRMREFSLVGLFLILLSCVLTLSALQAIYYHLLADQTDQRLNSLAAKLSNNIHAELRQMRAQLQEMCRAPELVEDLSAAEREEVVRKDPRRSVANANLQLPRASKYPYFNNVFWTDYDGHQIVKWSSIAYVTPMIDISSQAVYRRLTRPEEHSLFYLDGQSPPFVFDSVIPPNKLEYLSVLGTSTCDCNPDLCTRSDSKLSDDVTTGSAFIVAQPFSLIDPILPYGFGFALIDERGVVLFDSNKTRNTLENFYQESDRDRELYAAMTGHSNEHAITLSYMGKAYRARVIPVVGLAHAPWSLAVYRDLTGVRTLNLETMTMTSTVFLLILAVPVVLAAIWRASCRPRFLPEWLWPHAGRTATYLYLIALYALLLVVLLILGFFSPAEVSLIACVAVPYTAFVFTFWAFRTFPSAEEEQRTSRPVQLVPGALTAVATMCFVGFMIFESPNLNELALLIAVWPIAATPLMAGPRTRLISWCKQRLALRTRPGLYRIYYASVAMLLLLLVGILTPLVVFRNSLTIERRLSIKVAQLHLASAIERQRALLKSQCDAFERSRTECEELRMPNGHDAADGNGLWSRAKLAPLYRADSDFAAHSERQTNEFYSSWFQNLVYLFHYDVNQTAAEMSGVIADRGAPKMSYLERVFSGRTEFRSPVPEWAWFQEGSKLTLRKHGSEPQSSGERDSDVVLAAELPGYSSTEALIALPVGLGVMLAVGGLFWALARRVFLFQILPHRITGARQAAQAIRAGRNVLILIPPVSRWQLDEPKWPLDITGLANGPKWAELLDLNSIPVNKLIEIRGFERTTNDPEVDNQKFVFLQRLIQRGDTQVAVVMVVTASTEEYHRIFPDLEVIDLREEPFMWLAAYAGPAREQIWKECAPMPVLWPLGAQLARDIRLEKELEHEEKYTQASISGEILERADAYYRLVWKDCSAQQKFVLAQLAADGVLNPTNERAIQQLVRRGLIVKDPQFRIMNESFRRFLLSVPSPELKQHWLRESRKSGWGKAHGAFFTVMVVIGLFLLTTQNELWQSSAAYVTTAFGVLGTLAKLFNMFRSGTTGDKASS